MGRQVPWLLPGRARTLGLSFSSLPEVGLQGLRAKGRWRRHIRYLRLRLENKGQRLPGPSPALYVPVRYKEVTGVAAELLAEILAFLPMPWSPSSCVIFPFTLWPLRQEELELSKSSVPVTEPHTTHDQCRGRTPNLRCCLFPGPELLSWPGAQGRPLGPATTHCPSHLPMASVSGEVLRAAWHPEYSVLWEYRGRPPSPISLSQCPKIATRDSSGTEARVQD